MKPIIVFPKMFCALRWRYVFLCRECVRFDQNKNESVNVVFRFCCLVIFFCGCQKLWLFNIHTLRQRGVGKAGTMDLNLERFWHIYLASSRSIHRFIDSRNFQLHSHYNMINTISWVFENFGTYLLGKNDHK